MREFWRNEELRKLTITKIIKRTQKKSKNQEIGKIQKYLYAWKKVKDWKISDDFGREGERIQKTWEMGKIQENWNNWENSQDMKEPRGREIPELKI